MELAEKGWASLVADAEYGTIENESPNPKLDIVSALKPSDWDGSIL